MNDVMFDTLCSVPFCGSQIALRRHDRAYGFYESGIAGAPDVSIILIERGDEREISTLYELQSALKSRTCDLTRDVRLHEDDYALIISFLLGVGRLISSVELYDFLDHNYGFDVAQNLPRIEGGALCFACGKFSLEGAAPHLTKACIDLQDLTPSLSPVELPSSDGP